MSEKFDPTREYTYMGQPFKLYEVYPDQLYPVHGAYKHEDGTWIVRAFTYRDLIPVPRITYRQATKEDAARALMGERVKCRVRNHESYSWRDAVLLSYIPPELHELYHWAAQNTNSGYTDTYLYCEIEIKE